MTIEPIQVEYHITSPEDDSALDGDCDLKISLEINNQHAADEGIRNSLWVMYERGDAGGSDENDGKVHRMHEWKAWVALAHKIIERDLEYQLQEANGD